MRKSLQGRFLPFLAAAAVSTSLALPAAGGEDQDEKGFAGNPKMGEAGAQVDAVIAEAAAGGLPTAMLESKVKEGIVKKVKPAKILEVLKKLLGFCKTSKGLLEESGFEPSDATVEGMARLLELGLSEKNARRLIEGLGDAGAENAALGKGLVVTMMSMESGTDGGEAVSLVLKIVEKKGLVGLDAWIEDHKAASGATAGSGTTVKPKAKAPGTPKIKSKPHGK